MSRSQVKISRTTSISNRVEPVSRVARTNLPNSYCRVSDAERPSRSLRCTSASGAVERNDHVSSNFRLSEPRSLKSKVISGSSTRLNVQSKQKLITARSQSTRSRVDLSNQSRNVENASDWSIIDPPAFVPFPELPPYALRFLSSVRAKQRAAKSRLQSQPPLQALRADSNERGRNYSVRSAKRKPLSGSQVSSKKRSSTA